jgi:uncharacterized membrane protein required for colicin V production
LRGWGWLQLEAGGADSVRVMWLDTVVLVILGWFTLVGFLRGWLAAAMSVLTLVVAYGVALFGAARGGSAAAARLDLPEPLGPPLLGAVLFLVSFAVVGSFGRFLARRQRERLQGPRSAGDRLLGGCFGCLRGGFVVLLISFAAIWLDALRSTGQADFAPSIAGSRAAATTAAVVEAGVESALSASGSSGRFAARLAARPATSIAELKALIEAPAIAVLQADRLFWTRVESGSVDAALNRGSFLEIQNDAELRGRFVTLGLVDVAAAEDPGIFRSAVEAMLRELGPRLRGLREDPELQRLMSDPEVTALVQRGDTLALLGHRGFRDLVERVALR